MLSAGLPFADQAEAAAYLHDVLEDTKLTSEDLIEIGIRNDVVDIVERLTKQPGWEPQEYYRGIAESDAALLVKCADRCSNLEDALLEVRSKRDVARWKKYAEKTRADLLPMYVSMPQFHRFLEERLSLIEDVIRAS